MKEKLLILSFCCLVPIMLLLFGITNLPISYYSFLRLYILVSNLIFVWILYSWDDEKIGFRIITLLIIAILFNPIFPFYFKKAQWTYIDLITAIVFLLITIKQLFYFKIKKTQII